MLKHRIEWLPLLLHGASSHLHQNFMYAGAEGGGHFAGQISAALPGACIPNVTGSAVSVCVQMR